MEIQAQEEISQQQADETLMLAYAKGDASAFDQLYGRHKVKIYRFFLRQNLPVSVAEELSHDTWLKVINARESYDVKAQFTTYLFTVARRIAIDYSKKKSTQLEEIFSDQALFEQEQTEDNIDAKLVRQLSTTGGAGENSTSAISYSNEQLTLRLALKQQIASLPFDQREVFLLKQESGFSIEEISKIIDQNKEKVKSRWRYAVQKLRKGLSCYVN
ncbi:MAG: sigma-70 family RNA polymerase sigma factor [Alteromonadaceae bacterium]|nr:sigma-70 family RNA polymerase sigma factor [Alteromonadaceae bacterium]